MTPKKTLSSFRRSLVNRLMAAQRDIRNAKETVRRKNYAAEINQMELLSALKLLDEYTKRAEGEVE